MALDLELSKIIVSLQADEKNRRKQALEKVLKNISQEKLSGRLDDFVKIWDSIHRFLVRIMNDNVEVCRDLTVGILKIFLEALPPDDKHIMYVIPIMSRRLGMQELIESSEEVRLKCVSLLRMIIGKYKDLLASHIQDITRILARTVTDNYPNVKKESCRCISDYAKILSRHFYSQSEYLIKPILTNFMHQHYRVRLAAVETIGDVIQYGNSKSMEEVATPLAQRLFDQSGIVRKAVIEVSGRWLIKLPDRYSWWHKLLPLVMTGLHDELAEIRVKTAEMWDAAGKLYIEENENDEKLKDKMDYLTEDPEHYPLEISRPNLGCRVIAQQNFCKLINGISAELGDWLPDIRMRSAQLLSTLILNVEEDVTQHIEKLLPPMYRACNDEDKRVVCCVETAARYLGYFVQPKIYCQLVLPTLDESPTTGHLHVFAAILSGSERRALSQQLDKIMSFLQQPNICQSKKSNYQRQILSCCNSLLVVCKEDCKEVTEALFIVIFTMYAMSVELSIREEADRLLEILVNINSLKNIEDLFCNYMKPLITSIHDDCASWTVYSVESQIFCACLSRNGIAISRNMDLVLPILKKTMSKDADPELKLRHFILLSEYFLNNQNLCYYIEDPHRFVSIIIEELIMPGLIWAAGRAAEAIRTAVVCCLYAILQNTIINPDEKNEINKMQLSANEENKDSNVSITAKQFSSIFDKIVPVLISLVDDKAKKTRLYSIRAIGLLVTIGQRLSCLDDEHIHRTYPVILKRLDDGCDDVRHTAVEMLVDMWSAVSKDYDTVFSRSHIDALYTTMIVHLDDPESYFQEIMLDALKRVAQIYPELLHQKLYSCRPNFRNKAGVDILLEYCQSIFKQD
ncbi:PREDICTED: dynein assembly factor 5, axonemal [Cyphomyrmex costatus]|uniref:HEAT repeat-containing protein 2 n=1 Tax=Cyphomyrmex costatus TaxID=456900 RepID=A0A195CTV0_9HYME|nr:PREDICTED: dynein assembly factor 5, axonemal [Cyphomyrmex costatus]KYN03559.1 HEAT repeat-containing protein 2 [Cyphomyrmex costatus]